MLARWSRLLLLAAGLCTALPVASAQREPEGDYRHLVREALTEYAAGNFLEARTLFERAHAMRPSARTLRGLRLTAYELKRYEKAIAELKAALAASEHPLTPDQAAEARASIAKAQRFVGTLVVSAEPATAELSIDGQRVASGEHLLDAGDHTLMAEVPGRASRERRVTVQGGQRLSVVLRLSPAAVAEPVARPATRDAATPAGSAREDDASGGGSIGPWLLIAGGGATAVAGGVLLGLALTTKSEVEGIADGEKSWPDVKDDVESVPAQSLLGGLLLGVGLATTVAGVVWTLNDSGTEPVRVAFTGGSAQLEGRF